MEPLEGARCPTCARFFEDYLDLLDHIDPCARTKFNERALHLKVDEITAALFNPDRFPIARGLGHAGVKPSDDVAASSSELSADQRAIADTDAQEIVPGLYLGSISAARDEAFLAAARVKAIINCAAEARSLAAAKREAAGVEFLHQSVMDDTDVVDFAPEIRTAAAHLAASMQRYVLPRVENSCSSSAGAVGHAARASEPKLSAAPDGAPCAAAGFATGAAGAAGFGAPAAAAVGSGAGALPSQPSAIGAGGASGSTGRDAAGCAATGTCGMPMLFASSPATLLPMPAAAAAPPPAGAVLVHCAAGVSRSATVVIAYLVQHAGMSLRDAALAVKSQRPIAYPNAGFWRTLLAFEREVLERAAAVQAVATETAGAGDSDSGVGTVPGVGRCDGSAASSTISATPALVGSIPEAALWLHRTRLSVALPAHLR
jgi:hypothetical protein